MWVNGFHIGYGIHKWHKAGLNGWWRAVRMTILSQVFKAKTHCVLEGLNLYQSLGLFIQPVFTLCHSLSDLWVSHVQEKENKAHRGLKQLLYLTQVPNKHGDNQAPAFCPAEKQPQIPRKQETPFGNLCHLTLSFLQFSGLEEPWVLCTSKKWYSNHRNLRIRIPSHLLHTTSADDIVTEVKFTG